VRSVGSTVVHCDFAVDAGVATKVEHGLALLVELVIFERAGVVVHHDAVCMLYSL